MGKIEIRRNAGSYVLNPDARLLAQFKLGQPISLDFLQQLVDVRVAAETRSSHWWQSAWMLI